MADGSADNSESADRKRWIAENAYFRWVQEGYPSGDDRRHWFQAEKAATPPSATMIDEEWKEKRDHEFERFYRDREDWDKQKIDWEEKITMRCSLQFRRWRLGRLLQKIGVEKVACY